MKSTFTLKSPNGWLQDPNGKWFIHFEECENTSSSSDRIINIDMWGVMPNGAPSQFKSRIKASRHDSIKKWDKLCSSGWSHVITDSSNVA